MLVQISCSAPSPSITALQVLAKLQEAKNVTFEVNDGGDTMTPSLKSITRHPISGEKIMTSVSWVGCARTLSQLVPSLGLWEGLQVESWVEAASNTLIPILSSTFLFFCFCFKLGADRLGGRSFLGNA